MRGDGHRRAQPRSHLGWPLTHDPSPMTPPPTSPHPCCPPVTSRLSGNGPSPRPNITSPQGRPWTPHSHAGPCSPVLLEPGTTFRAEELGLGWEARGPPPLLAEPGTMRCPGSFNPARGCQDRHTLHGPQPLRGGPLRTRTAKGSPPECQQDGMPGRRGRSHAGWRGGTWRAGDVRWTARASEGASTTGGSFAAALRVDASERDLEGPDLGGPFGQASWRARPQNPGSQGSQCMKVMVRRGLVDTHVDTRRHAHTTRATDAFSAPEAEHVHSWPGLSRSWAGTGGALVRGYGVTLGHGVLPEPGW